MCILTAWTPQSTEALARGVRQETEISHANWKGRNDHCFFPDMILYVENLQDSTQKAKLLELVNELSKVAGYRLNKQI